MFRVLNPTVQATLRWKPDSLLPSRLMRTRTILEHSVVSALGTIA